MEPNQANVPKVSGDTQDLTQDLTQKPTTNLTKEPAHGPAQNPTQNLLREEAMAVAPARPKGPNASAIVFGLVAIALAGLVIPRETMDLRVDWSRVGPGGIIGLGVVMAVIGAIGLVRRHDDS